jgi:hypothetical protein
LGNGCIHRQLDIVFVGDINNLITNGFSRAQLSHGCKSGFVSSENGDAVAYSREGLSGGGTDAAGTAGQEDS